MKLDFLGDLRRTHTCGQLRASDAGKRVTLMGWVNRRRDLGGLIFIDLRDRTGVTQIVFDPQRSKDPGVHDKAGDLRNEYVIAVIGTVHKREGNTVNPNLPTGEIEITAEELRLLNESKPLPFLPGDEKAAEVDEEVRLKYRYLDLRRTPMQNNIELRHKVALAIRNDLAQRGFFEIETPFMTRSTPEGARDYLVPSRVYPGEFYALPQSPQLFKQILMISGFDKYFQIVRCFRDEDLRADRQPEFTQIDLEMTFPQQDRVFEVVEGFLRAAFAAAGHDLKTPFPRMTYDEAMRWYGIDKPDLRLPAMTDVREAFTSEQREKLQLGNGPILAIRTPGVGGLSSKERNELTAWMREQSAAKYIDFSRLQKSEEFASAVGKIRELLSAASRGARSDQRDEGPAFSESDLVVLLAPTTPLKDEKDYNFHKAAGQVRLDLARRYADRHKLFAKTGDTDKDFRWVWVTDFPMFEWDGEEGRFVAAHHPFTSPHEQDMAKVLSGEDLGSVRAVAYDVVLNGTELGSGSIRIHRQDVQRQIFKALGMTEEEAKSRFGFFLEALEYGTPPHGGIALGLDRIVMILAGADSLREVIPFPKTAKAVDLMVDAPTPVSPQQLKELGIAVKK
jgi:aspartyl-tRNA synthetase